GVARGRRGRRAVGERVIMRPAEVQARLFPTGVHALNVGLAAFATPPRAHGATVLQLDWRPPAGGDRELGLLVARLEDDPDDPVGSRIRTPNETAVPPVLQARPMLIAVLPAREALVRF